jgi:hypothetical protein
MIRDIIRGKEERLLQLAARTSTFFIQRLFKGITHEYYDSR